MNKTKIIKKVKHHLKGDIKTFKHEADDDRKLIKSLEGKPMKKQVKSEKKVKKSVRKNKMKKVMHEFKEGELNSGSGAKVTNPKQAVAIAYSEARKAKKKKKK